MTAYNPWNDAGPLTRETLDNTIEAVQDRLDLLAVLSERYGQHVLEVGEHWRAECFLPSLVPGFVGTCAQQDASETRGNTPRNLWVKEGDSTLVWGCHSCKRHGDVIDLIEYADGLPREGQAISLRAVRAAAKLAGVTYIMDDRAPDDSDDPDPLVCVAAPVKRVKRTAVAVPFAQARALNSAAADYWHATLLSSAGEAARAELARRSVTDEQIERYRLGYALPHWRKLAGKLKPAHKASALALGLVGKNRHGNLYDRQRDRIVFPYCEPARGDRPPSITGFAGRKLSDDPKAPKWLNSMNAPGVWEKKSALLGLYQAHARITAGSLSRVGIVEGGHDTLALDRLGEPSCALVSAALSEQHCEVLLDVLGVSELTIMLDGDPTGRREALVAATTALRSGIAYEDLTLVDPDDGHDPGSLHPDRLGELWHAPLAVLEFAARYGELLSTTHRLALLSVLPTDASKTLQEQWGLEPREVARHRDGVAATASPLQQLAALLLQQPELAGALSAAEVADVFEQEASALRRLSALEFGESTAVAALPAQVRRSWLTCRLQRGLAKVGEHDKADPFAAGDSADAFREWFGVGEALRTDVALLRKQLDAVGITD